MRRSLVFLCLAVATLSATAQKVKYKDLFVLLNAKSYDDAEPFLRTFLKDPKNDDHAHSHLSMGFLLEYRASQLDLIDSTEAFNVFADSAIFYLEKAKTLIDEKEVKKRDDYYQDYARRDLRTGKFGVKMSDVHLDIDDRVEAMNLKKDRVQDLKRYYVRTNQYYQRAFAIFGKLQNSYADENDLLLRSDDAMMAQMDSMIVYFDSLRANFNKFDDFLEMLELVKQRPIIILEDIANFKTDGQTQTNFRGQQVIASNYKFWAQGIKDKYNKNIVPFRNEIEAFDQRLSDLKDKMERESISAKEELEAISVKEIGEKMMALDGNPLPSSIFNFRIKELEFISRRNELSNTGQLDSADIRYRIEVNSDLLGILNASRFIQGALARRDVDAEYPRYKRFVDNRYQGSDGLKQYIAQTSEFLSTETAILDSLVAQLEESDKWAIHENDSIPLVLQESFATDTLSNNYFPLQVMDTTSYDHLLVAGLIHQQTDTLKAFFAAVNRNRQVEQYFVINLDSLIYSESTTVDPVQDLRSNICASNNEFMVLFYSGTQAGTRNGYLSRMTPEGGVEWSRMVDITSLPISTELIEESSVYIIHYDLAGAESDNGSGSGIIFNKDGTIRQELSDQ